MTETLLSLDDIQEVLDDIVFKPFAQEGWYFTIEVDSSDQNYVILSLVHETARDSRSHDYAAEWDDWSAMECGRRQTATERHLGLMLLTEQDVQDAVTHLICYFMAHEGLEWTRRWKDNELVMLHDPHEDGDVRVEL